MENEYLSHCIYRHSGTLSSQILPTLYQSHWPDCPGSGFWFQTILIENSLFPEQIKTRLLSSFTKGFIRHYTSKWRWAYKMSSYVIISCCPPSSSFPPLLQLIKTTNRSKNNTNTYPVSICACVHVSAPTAPFETTPNIWVHLNFLTTLLKSEPLVDRTVSVDWCICHLQLRTSLLPPSLLSCTQ